MAQAAVLLAAAGAGTGAGAAVGSIASSIVNVLAEIAKIIAKLALEMLKWFRDTVLSNPWRALAFFGSAAIMMT